MGAAHVPVSSAGSAGGRLTIAGRSALDLAAEYGTPLFVYDRSQISRTVEQLRHHLPKRVSLHYAVKANPHPDVVAHIAPLVDGLDVASIGELELVRAHAPAQMDVSFAGPGKRDAELKKAIALGGCINLESENEMQRLAAIARRAGVKARAAVRINPSFELGGSGMRMGGGAKQFGIDDDAVPALLARWPSDALEFWGFHIFTGSQSLSADALVEAHASALELALTMAEHAPAPCRFINIGGGLGVPYFPGDAAVDLPRVGAGLAAAIEPAGARLGATKLVLELGRYMVAEAGVYLAQVIDKKTSRGVTYLVTDGGLHHQLAVSGNFGQAFRKNYPVALANSFAPDVDIMRGEIVNIVGCLCTPLDRLGDRVLLPKAEVGDIIAVFRCGAYGPTASPSGFLGHPAAKECLV